MVWVCCDDGWCGGGCAKMGGQCGGVDVHVHVHINDGNHIHGMKKKKRKDSVHVCRCALKLIVCA